jgi:hypothetical protein
MQQYGMDQVDVFALDHGSLHSLLACIVFRLRYITGLVFSIHRCLTIVRILDKNPTYYMSTCLI